MRHSQLFILLVAAALGWVVFGPFPGVSQTISESLVEAPDQDPGASLEGEPAADEAPLKAPAEQAGPNHQAPDGNLQDFGSNLHRDLEELLSTSESDLQSDDVLPRPRQKRHFLSSFKLPDTLEFAGETVPLDEWQVRERIEFEFYQFLEAEGESIIIAKRTGRCFPPVEKQLEEAGLPDDLKYMLLVESKCVSAAYSRKRASGPWQFIRSTGKRYKLRSNKWRDERRNLERSTGAAIKYLSHLKKKMGDWYLAMAAYNAGERRIKKRLKEQRVDNYWQLHYVRETMRYVPRIIAAKEIFSQPEKYIGISREELYAPLETETVTVRVKKRKEHLGRIAERHGSYFLELKLLNPELRRSHLPRGTYKLKVPKRECPFGCFKQDRSR